MEAATHPHAHGKAVKSVLFNDGTSEDLVGIVFDGEVPGNISVGYRPEGAGNLTFADDVPRREKSDYDTNGGGMTYHINEL